MSEDLVNDIKNAVSVINDPHMGVSIVEMGIVQDIIVNNDEAKLIIEGHAMADSINEMLNK